MDTERENHAWHIAGHAWAATEFTIQLHRVSLDGFSEADLASRGDARRLDATTMIVPPQVGPVGTYDHTIANEQLVEIALAGPIIELHHRQLPKSVSNIQQQHIYDWQQAWLSAGFLYADEAQRMRYLDQKVAYMAAVIVHCGPLILCGELVPQLLESGALTGTEIQATFDRARAKIKAMQEAESERESKRSRRRGRCSEPEYAIGDLFGEAWSS